MFVFHLFQSSDALWSPGADTHFSIRDVATNIHLFYCYSDSRVPLHLFEGFEDLPTFPSAFSDPPAPPPHHQQDTRWTCLNWSLSPGLSVEAEMQLNIWVVLCPVEREKDEQLQKKQVDSEEPLKTSVLFMEEQRPTIRAAVMTPSAVLEMLSWSVFSCWCSQEKYLQWLIVSYRWHWSVWGPQWKSLSGRRAGEISGGDWDAGMQTKEESGGGQKRSWRWADVPVKLSVFTNRVVETWIKTPSVPDGWSLFMFVLQKNLNLRMKNLLHLSGWCWHPNTETETHPDHQSEPRASANQSIWLLLFDIIVIIILLGFVIIHFYSKKITF